MVPVMWRARLILTRVNWKCNVRARPSTRNLPKSFKHVFSQTTRCIGLKSNVCNSPGESLYAGERNAAIRKIKRDRWLLLLWASYSCSGRRSSSANSSFKTVRGRTTYRSSSTDSSSKTVRGRITLPSVTASSPRKVHPWKLLKGGGIMVKGEEMW